jgi:hypothetical protein
VSCVGRKIVLDQRIDEEIERVRAALGPDVVLAGFYSYGEISPLGLVPGCELHNQTMTIATFESMIANKLHKLLLKQVSKKYGDIEALPPESQDLLRTVSRTYGQVRARHPARGALA